MYRGATRTFYERASASAPLVNGLLWHSPRDGAGSGTYFDDILLERLPDCQKSMGT